MRKQQRAAYERAIRHGWNTYAIEGTSIVMRRGSEWEPYLIIIDNNGNVSNGY